MSNTAVMNDLKLRFAAMKEPPKAAAKPPSDVFERARKMLEEHKRASSRSALQDAIDACTC